MILKAAKFCIRAHAGQKRKYTGEPYHNHCFEVARYIRDSSFEKIGEYSKDEMICAALLHDTVEDTDTTFKMISNNFGDKVATLVFELTDVSKKTDGNRATRKKIDREHNAKASDAGKTIKCADLISNTSSIVCYDKNFAKVYFKEKQKLMRVLKGAHPSLYATCAMSLLIGFSLIEMKDDAECVFNEFIVIP